MSKLLQAQISPFLPTLMSGRPCQEQAVFTWIMYSHWCLASPASVKFICENSGTSSAKVSIAIKTLMDSGLIAEERVTESRIGYIPTLLVVAAGAQAPGENAVEPQEVRKDGETGVGVVGDVVIGDSKGKEKKGEAGAGEKGKKGAEPPTLATIEAVCARKGWLFEPKRFHDYYAEREWRMRDGTPITTKNWFHLGASWHESGKLRQQSERHKYDAQRPTSLDAIL